MSKEKIRYLNKVYSSFDSAGSFYGPRQLYAITQKQDRFKFNIDEIKDYLATKTSYSLYRDVKRKFKRRSIVLPGPHILADVDLMSVKRIAKENDDIIFLFCYIDCFSRQLVVTPIKDKSTASCLSAFKIIFENRHLPRNVRFDGECALNSGAVSKYLDGLGINHYTTRNTEIGANYVERVQKTLRIRLYRYFHEYDTERFVEILPKLVKSYNETPHSAFKYYFSPEQVTEENASAAFWLCYTPSKYFSKNPIPRRQTTSKRSKPLYKVGDHVRIVNLRHAFARSFDFTFSREIFVITAILPRENINIYKLEDILGEELVGTFYTYEIARAPRDTSSMFVIEEVLKRKKYRGKHRQFVSYKDLHKKFNRWIDSRTKKPIK